MAEKLELEFHNDEEAEQVDDGSVDVDVTLRFSLNELKEKGNVVPIDQAKNARITHKPVQASDSNRITRLEHTIKKMQADLDSVQKQIDHENFNKLEKSISRILGELSREYPKSIRKLKMIKSLLNQFNRK